MFSCHRKSLRARSMSKWTLPMMHLKSKLKVQDSLELVRRITDRIIVRPGVVWKNKIILPSLVSGCDVIQSQKRFTKCRATQISRLVCFMNPTQIFQKCVGHVLGQMYLGNKAVKQNLDQTVSQICLIGCLFHWINTDIRLVAAALENSFS